MDPANISNGLLVFVWVFSGARTCMKFRVSAKKAAGGVPTSSMNICMVLFLFPLRSLYAYDANAVGVI